MSKFVVDKLPKTCDKCRFFVDDILGCTAYCVFDAEYTDEEINAEEDGNLNMYYHGCLSHRPNSCPLKQKEEPNA